VMRVNFVVVAGISLFALSSVTAQQVAVQTRPLDPANMDPTTPACTDFYQYANGAWAARTQIPPAFPSWGSFTELAERNRLDLRRLLERAASNRRSLGDPDMKRLGDFYATCMDSTAAERQGPEPLRPIIARLDALRTTHDLQQELARMHSAGISALFSFTSRQDARRSTEVIARASQGGLTLPDREYYLRGDSASIALRQKYVQHMASLLTVAGIPRQRAEHDATVALEIETALARAGRSRVELRDPLKNYNRLQLGQIAELTPRWNWAWYFRDRGRPDISVVDVGQPEFFRAVDSLLTVRPITDWQAYLRWRVVKSAAPLLSSSFVNEDFAFDRLLGGEQELLPRWQRCVRLADRQLGEILGRAYVQQRFTPAAKARALEMVTNLRAAFRERLATRAWMSDETRARAYAKLDAFTQKIGYPDRWRDYSELTLTQSSLYAMVVATRDHELRRDLAKIAKPVDRSEWGMTPPTVNAYYNAALNEIVFPAGILQPPFFDPNADDAVNYGGMGAVIGHELSHGFDDRGSQYDPEGNLRDWWTEEDKRRFQERTGIVVQQFDAYTVLDSVRVQGRLTLGENIADLGGLSLAYAALQKALEAKPRSAIDGFTPEQRFFLAWAQIWRRNIRPEALRRQVVTDSHSPARWRVNGPLSNMPEFVAAFGCKPGDPMVREANLRAEIW
jgi:putative endopeptidase